jgi:DNA-binding MarR family transcriptional regulator
MTETTATPGQPPIKLARELRRATTHLQRRLRQERPAEPLPALQTSLLGHLYDRGTLTPGALAAIDGLQPQSVTRAIGALEAAGLISRERGPADGREAHLSLTAAGRAALRAEVEPRDRWLAHRLHTTISWRQRFQLRLAVNLINHLAESPRPPMPAARVPTPPSIAYGVASPIFPSSDIHRSTQILAALGFHCSFEADETYSICDLNGVGVHFALSDDHDPGTRAGCAFIEVDDARRVRQRLLDAGVPEAGGEFGLPQLHSQQEFAEHWKAGNSLARVTEIVDQPWQVREFAYIDPDNNLFRFGTLLPVDLGVGLESSYTWT